MPNFKLTIRDTRVYEIEVTADSEDTAIETASEMDLSETEPDFTEYSIDFQDDQ